jgi:acyl-CoA dehydrogenase
VKERYVLSRPIPRYAAIAERLAKVGAAARRGALARAARDAHGRSRIAERQGGEHGQGRRRAGRHLRRASRPSRSAARTGAREEHALLEKWFRDIKVYDIFEGTGQIQRIVIVEARSTRRPGSCGRPVR